MTIRRTELPTPNQPDAAGIVSWVHLGDLHMTNRGEQNYHDLCSVVNEVNAVMAHSLSFAYLPGDNAEHGDEEEYVVVREALDQLRVPWYSIVGDHDVHTRSLENFLRYMMPAHVYGFEIGGYRFLVLNTFDSADPKKFGVSGEQLSWLNQEMEEARRRVLPIVLLLHCYPSDLGESADELSRLIRDFKVLLLDMGHTHYNEIAHDGNAIYTTTRSIGQIEEGPVGFSITNLDSGVVSWRFKALREWPLVMITTPSDERLISDSTSPNQIIQGVVPLRAKVWGDCPIVSGTLSSGSHAIPLRQIQNSAVWTAEFDPQDMPDGTHSLRTDFTDAEGKLACDEILIRLCRAGNYEPPSRKPRDQDNAVGAWVSRGILGTQLGPNKNGRKW